MTAEETFDLGCETALAEARRLIRVNCAYGSVSMYYYPPSILRYVTDQLKPDGYTFEVGGQCNPGLTISWLPNP